MQRLFSSGGSAAGSRNGAAPWSRSFAGQLTGHVRCTLIRWKCAGDSPVLEAVKPLLAPAPPRQCVRKSTQTQSLGTALPHPLPRWDPSATHQLSK